MFGSCTTRGNAGPPDRPARHTRRSFLTIDLIMAIGIVAIMATLFSLGVREYARARHETDARRAALAAAELELHRLRAGLATAGNDSDGFRRISEDLELQTTLTPGQGPWREFDHITVVARQRSKHGHWARVELSAYVPRREMAP